MRAQSKRARIAARAGIAGMACFALLIVSAGCSSVKPYERGYLADPIMTFDEDANEAARNVSWIETREGSTGGTGGAGGGCACK